MLVIKNPDMATAISRGCKKVANAADIAPDSSCRLVKALQKQNQEEEEEEETHYLVQTYVEHNKENLYKVIPISCSSKPRQMKYRGPE